MTKAPVLTPIQINNQPHRVAVPISGAQLRALGNIPVENQLFEESHGQDPDVLISDDVLYEPKPGTHYYDLPRGTVGDDLADQLAHAARQLTAGQAQDQVDGTKLLRWRGALPDPWEPREVEMLIVVPPAYPAQAPSGFDVIGPVTLAGAAPAGSGTRELDGVSCTHFCWNPSGQINYAALDGLWRFAKFSEKRFLS